MMKINELILENTRIPVHKKFKFDGIVYNNDEGLGQVPFNSNVLYMGFAAIISADDFLKLALKADRKESAQKFADMIIDEDVEIASPFLELAIMEDEDGKESTNNPSGVRVAGHEGRGRALAIKMLSEGYRKEDQKEKVSGDVMVHFFMKYGFRARDLGDGFFEYIKNHPIQSEDGNIVNVNFKEIFHDRTWR